MLSLIQAVEGVLARLFYGKQQALVRGSDLSSYFCFAVHHINSSHLFGNRTDDTATHVAYRLRPKSVLKKQRRTLARQHIHCAAVGVE